LPHVFEFIVLKNNARSLRLIFEFSDFCRGERLSWW